MLIFLKSHKRFTERILLGTLDTYKAIEFSRHPAGTILGMLLADQGATVIKVEPLHGDPLKGTPEFAVWNRGKNSAISDLTQQSVLELVKEADIVIDCLNPGEAENLNLTFSGLSGTNPGLVVISLPAFAKGHKYEHLPARESLIASSSGVFASSPSGEKPISGEGPSFHGLYYASAFAAMTASAAVTAALIQRTVTTRGQQITVPIHDSMYQGMGTALVRHSNRAHGRQEGHPVIARFYKCSDNRWVNVNIAMPRFLEPFLRAVGRPEWTEALNNINSLSSDAEVASEWRERFAEIWTERAAEDWETFMADVGVPVTMCRTTEEWMNEPHAAESEAVIEVTDPTFGRMRQPGLIVRTHGNPGQVAGFSPRSSST